jgi:U3 small nucleolar RNA-associated protein 13
LTQDGEWLISTLGEEVQITEVQTGLPVARVRGVSRSNDLSSFQDTTAITSLALSYHTSPPTLITSHQSQMIRFYPLPPAVPDTPLSLTYTRQVPKAHNAIILVSAVSPDNTLLATGSSDGIVKVWDLAGGYVTHMFRGHGGPVSALRFSYGQKTELLTGSTDGRVRLFDLKDAARAGKARAVMEGHVSVVRGIDVSSDGQWAVTGGRDKVVLVWDLRKEPKLIQTLIVGEQVESVGFLSMDRGVLDLPAGRLRCWTGGDKGVVKVWDVFKAEEVGQMKAVEGVDEEVDEDEQRGIINVL